MYDPGIKVGDIVTNEEMRSAFAVGNMGGMRKSNTHNCLVLISDHTKGSGQCEEVCGSESGI